MAKKKEAPAPIPVSEPQGPAGRVSVINLQGTKAEWDWFAKLNKQTRFSKATIVRNALVHWAKAEGYAPYPSPNG